MKNPLTPRLAASMAAYSSLRVLSEVQYWHVTGGAGADTGSGAWSTGAGGGSEGKWKNWFEDWEIWVAYVVCLVRTCGRDDDVE